MKTFSFQACDNAARGTVQCVSDASFAIQFKVQNLGGDEAAKLASISKLFPSQSKILTFFSNILLI